MANELVFGCVSQNYGVMRCAISLFECIITAVEWMAKSIDSYGYLAFYAHPIMYQLESWREISLEILLSDLLLYET
jgi:hypothetical protein